MEQGLVLSNNNNNNGSIIKDDEKVCVYDFFERLPLAEMKRRFCAANNKYVVFKNMKLNLFPHDSNKPEYEKKEILERINICNDMLEVLEIYKPDIKKLVFNFFFESQGQVMVNLFKSIAGGSYPHLSVLTFDFFLFSRETALGLVSMLNSQDCKIEQLTLVAGNITLLDKNYEDHETVLRVLLSSIVLSQNLCKVTLQLGDFRPRYFYFLNCFRIAAFKNNKIRELTIHSCPSVALPADIKMGWLRCFPNLEILRLRNCQLGVSMVRDICKGVSEHTLKLAVLDISHNVPRSCVAALKVVKHSMTALFAVKTVLRIRGISGLLFTFDPNTIICSQLRDIVALLEHYPAFKLNEFGSGHYREILNRRQHNNTLWKSRNFDNQLPAASE